METIITTTNFLIFGLILLLPILLHIYITRKNPRRIAVKFFILGSFLMAFMILIFAAWIDLSSLILLNHLGYSVDGMNYDNVLPENREQVDTLITSISGIGWPLKAIFGFVTVIPYLLLVYFGKQIIDRIKISGFY